MNKFAAAFLAVLCIFGMTACGDTTVNNTRIIKHEPNEGPEKVKVEIKTLEMDDRSKGERISDEKKEPLIKAETVETHKN